MQARFYLPMWGRFASPDPARDQHFEETQSWNIYSYVQNNPVMMTDPTGMYSWKEFKDDVKAVAKKVVNKWKDDAKTVANDPNLQAMVKSNGFLIIPTVPGGSPGSVPTPSPALVTPEGIVVQGGAATLPAAIPNPAAVVMTGGTEGGGGNRTGDSGSEKTPQDRRLTKQEIKQLEKETGQSAHDIKGDIVGNKNMSKYDLFKSKSGEVVVKLKNGKGPGEPTGLTL